MKKRIIANIKNIFLLNLIILLASCQLPHSIDKNAGMEASIDSLLKIMTLEEKIGMIHASSSFTSGGVERLGIPELVMSDGPHGVRHEHGRDWTVDETDEDFVTYLPVGIALASTWNKDLGYKFGTVLGSEAKARGKDIILGPGVNIIRTPLNGRNFEYLSEDPYLASQMAVGYIKGVQDQEISACVKHFVANNQETDRNKVDVIVSERALREIYLPAFRASIIDADVNSVMGAYNKVRGQYCTHHEYLINEILKDEYGFSGIVISDWSAVHDTKEALLYGTDIEMGTDLSMGPNPDYNKFYLADSALAMIRRGEVHEKYVDDKVRRILRVMYKTRMFGTRTPGEVNTKAHQQVALQVAEEGIVLLQNDGILPLNAKKYKTIAVIGHNATRKHAHEGGSSQVKALYEVTPLEGITGLVGADSKIIYAEGYKPLADKSVDKKLAKEAIDLAASADVVIFIGGWIHNYDPTVWGRDAYDAEGLDKTNLKLISGQEELINDIAKSNPNMVVVIFGGSNVEMANWMGNAKAILQAWYPGMEGGNALANILFGKVSPSGKLPMTFANSHMEYPAHAIGEFPGTDLREEYKDDIFVGYRYFEKEEIRPLFPFGYGLSYTTFEFSDINVIKKRENIVVTCSITNTGNMKGAEVAQLYVHPVNPQVERPIKELKGFEKVYLNPDQSQQVSFILNREMFSYFNEEEMDWKLDQGSYEIQIGSSSGDIKLKKEIDF
ncbi:MAG: glycoside hydrolase family 3 C-terminal domain-containing protein [Bacteroidales bacterium]